MDWTVEYIVSQVMVFFALICMCASYLVKSKKIILILGFAISVFYMTGYILLGAWTGAIVNAISIFRAVWFFVNNKKGKTKDYLSLIFFEIVYITSGIITFANWFDIFSVFAALIYTYSIWQQSITFFRWSALVVSACWVVYNLCCGSIMGLIVELILVVFEIIGIIKLYIKFKKTRSAENNEHEIIKQTQQNQ